MEYDMALVQDSRDVVLMLIPYCEACAIRKLGILRIFPIVSHDAKDLCKNYKIKAYRVRCECAVFQ
jgi:hypothetical protein